MPVVLPDKTFLFALSSKEKHCISIDPICLVYLGRRMVFPQLCPVFMGRRRAISQSCPVFMGCHRAIPQLCLIFMGHRRVFIQLSLEYMGCHRDIFYLAWYIWGTAEELSQWDDRQNGYLHRNHDTSVILSSSNSLIRKRNEIFLRNKFQNLSLVLAISGKSYKLGNSFKI